MPFTKASLLAISLLFSLSLPVMGQETTGTILGTVTDSSGAVISGASVTVTNIEKGAVLRKLQTGKDGTYTAALLPIGHYSVSVEAQGFKKFNRTDIELNIRDQVRIDAALAPGSVTEAVTVEASALHVDTESATSSGLISGSCTRLSASSESCSTSLSVRALACSNLARIVALVVWRLSVAIGCMLSRLREAR